MDRRRRHGRRLSGSRHVDPRRRAEDRLHELLRRARHRARPRRGPSDLSLYPVPGALDVLLAPEFLEVGRSIELGFPSPARTTIIASTHRLYSIHEKIVTGRGIYPIERLHEAARAFSRSLVAFDALALAREHRSEANAVLLGALAGSGALPLSGDAYRQAIRAKGVQVDANLRGFEAGFAAAARGAAPAAPAASAPTPTAPTPSPDVARMARASGRAAPHPASGARASHRIPGPRLRRTSTCGVCGCSSSAATSSSLEPSPATSRCG